MDNSWPASSCLNYEILKKNEILSPEIVWEIFRNSKYFDTHSINSIHGLVGRDDNPLEKYGDVLARISDDGLYYTDKEQDTELFLFKAYERISGISTFKNSYILQGDKHAEACIIESPTMHQLLITRLSNTLYNLEQLWDKCKELSSLTRELNAQSDE